MKKGEFDPIYPVVLLFEKLKIIRMNNQKDVLIEP
jgi:hypothetical protein